MDASMPTDISVLTGEAASKSVTRRVLVASEDAGDAQWLQMRLGQGLLVEHCLCNVESVAAFFVHPVSAMVVVFDGRTDMTQPAAVVQWLKQCKAEITVLGMGYATNAKVPLAALRAGVKDFLDLGSNNSEDVRKPVWEACTRVNVERNEVTQGKVLALAGARAGMGVTTIAVHLCAALSALCDNSTSGQAYEPHYSDLGLILLDLGFPLRDGQMLLGLNGRFHMLDAMQSANRLDKSMLEAALVRHGSGASVLSWPAQAHMLREVAPLSTSSIIHRMRSFFAWQVIDVGGLPSQDMLQEVVQAADKVWVVCDQSVGGIVSMSEMLKNLRSNAAAKNIEGLIVNRAYKSHGLPPVDIAKRVALPLLSTLAAREEALLRSSSAGVLLSESTPSDPFVQEIKKMAQGLFSAYDLSGSVRGQRPTDAPKRWLGWLPSIGRSA